MMVLPILGALLGLFVLRRMLSWLTGRRRERAARLAPVHAIWLIVDPFAHRGRLEPERGAA